jgi:hypothetical protein
VAKPDPGTFAIVNLIAQQGHRCRISVLQSHSNS